MTHASPWWAPDVYAVRRPFLKARGRITAAVRVFFEDEGFAEVETAALQISGGNETHLSAFETELIGADGARSRLYLHTSPEFACKKLLAAGETRIFNLARAFRNRERSALHHPEFTMLEWYRAGEPTLRTMEDCAGLLVAAAQAAGATDFVWRGRLCDPFAKPEPLSVCEAFARYAGVDLAPLLDDRDSLARVAGELGLRVTADDAWSDLLSKILSEKIEGQLGCGRPTLLCDYPASEAALARLNPDDPRFADRFELYVCGVELANGFYGERYPIDEELLEALAIMPAASGVALGLDRLVMLASGATRIDQVLWTPVA